MYNNSFSQLSLPYKTPWSGRLQQQTFTFSQFWWLGVHVPARGFPARTLFLAFTSAFLLCIHIGGWGRDRTDRQTHTDAHSHSRLSGVSSYKGKNPIIQTLPSWPPNPKEALLKAPSPNTITLELGGQHMNFGRTQLNFLVKATLYV